MRAREIALAGFGLLLISTTSSFAQAGRMCIPAVANPEMYTNCRIAVTPRGQVCQCVPQPAAILDHRDSRGGPGGGASSVGGGGGGDFSGSTDTGKGNNGFGNGPGDGSPNGRDDATR